RDGEDVAEVADRDGLPQVHAELEAVRAIEGGDPPHPLGAEPGARAVRGPRVVRSAEDSNVVGPAGPDVLDEGRLEEGVDARVVRQLAPAERGDGAVHDRVGPLEAELQSPGDLLLVPRVRDQRLAFEGAASLRAVT